jgi:hypothetical protein
LYFEVTEPNGRTRRGGYAYSVGSGPKIDDWVLLGPGEVLEANLDVMVVPAESGEHVIKVVVVPTTDPYGRVVRELKVKAEEIKPENLVSRIDGRVRVDDNRRSPSDFEGTVTFFVLKTDVGHELVYQFRDSTPDGDSDVITERLRVVPADIKLIDFAVSATQQESYNHEIWLKFEEKGEAYLLRLRQNEAELVGIDKLASPAK